MNDLNKMLDDGIKSICENGINYNNYLKSSAFFHDYSFRNVMLILSQNSNATQVAGYRSWIKLGRQVKKGEQSIKICAPMLFKITDANDKDKEIIKYKAVSVFDVSQTDGEIVLNNKIDNVKYDEIFTAIKSQNNFSIEFAQISTKSTYNQKTNTITLKMGMKDKDTVKSLLKELSKINQDKYNDDCESVACVVSSYFGLDNSDYNFNLSKISNLGLDKIEDMLEQVHTISNYLITSISENIDKVKQVSKYKEPPLTLQEKIKQAVGSVLTLPIFFHFF